MRNTVITAPEELNQADNSKGRWSRKTRLAASASLGNSKNMVPMAGLEPAQLAPPPPQGGVSTNSTTSALNPELKYYLPGTTGTSDAPAGCAGASAGGTMPDGGDIPEGRTGKSETLAGAVISVTLFVSALFPEI